MLPISRRFYVLMMTILISEFQFRAIRLRRSFNSMVRASSCPGAFGRASVGVRRATRNFRGRFSVEETLQSCKGCRNHIPRACAGLKAKEARTAGAWNPQEPQRRHVDVETVRRTFPVFLAEPFLLSWINGG